MNKKTIKLSRSAEENAFLRLFPFAIARHGVVVVVGPPPGRTSLGHGVPRPSRSWRESTSRRAPVSTRG